MKKFLLIMITLIVSLSVASAKKVYFEYDMATFESDTDKVRFEFYYSFPDTSFKYVKCDDYYKGDLEFKLTIKAENGPDIVETWTASAVAESENPALKNIMFGTRAIKLIPGKYKCIFSGRDLNDINTKFEYKFDANVKSFIEDNINLSDLELTAFYKNKDENSSEATKMFEKNDLIVIPNPSATIISEDPYVKVYYELYGVKSLIPGGYKLKYRILDGAKREITAVEKEFESNSDTISNVLEIPINVVPSGSYYVELIASSKAGKLFQSKTIKKIYVVNPGISPDLKINFTESMTFEASEFATMDQERVELEYRQAKIIATAEEKNSYEKLTELKGKQRFLFKFWTMRKPDTINAINLKYVEYRELIDYSNNYYGTANKDGWETDRGRVTLKYGKPTQIDRSTMQENQRNYETWHYDKIQGGATFYFVETNPGGGYRLVHSTATGEIYDTNWFNNYVIIRNNSNDDIIDKVTGKTR